MAILHSEDKSIKSRFEIRIVKEEIKNKENLSWVPYELLLKSGEKELLFKKDTNDNGAGDYVFSLHPINEFLNLSNALKNFINDNAISTYSFEPLEPSFEIIVEKSHDGYSFTCWVDSGNVISDHYTWDGFGLRIFVTKENILNFAEQLEKESKEFTCQKEQI